MRRLIGPTGARRGRFQRLVHNRENPVNPLRRVGQRDSADTPRTSDQRECASACRVRRSKGRRNMTRWRNLAIVLSVLIVFLIVSFLIAPKNTLAATIVKSKSNVANNRTASPIGESHPGPWDVVPLCSSCAYPG